MPIYGNFSVNKHLAWSSAVGRCFEKIRRLPVVQSCPASIRNPLQLVKKRHSMQPEPRLTAINHHITAVTYLHHVFFLINKYLSALCTKHLMIECYFILDAYFVDLEIVLTNLPKDSCSAIVFSSRQKLSSNYW